ncbi:MAG TPA: hypothetical protein VF522_24220 [Ramlibacter sp.]|uniref:hypothetical protein n=1 Tax=Ramlibacter sp. TaxID=1917967 RepID=UPI002ED60400
MSRSPLTASFVALVLALSGLAGCMRGDDREKSFYSTDAEYVQDLRTLMTRRGLQHQDAPPHDGMVGLAYLRADDAKVDAIQLTLSRQVMTKHKDPEATEHLQRVLAAMGQDFIAVQQDDGTWIKWYPESERQMKEVDTKVARFLSDLHAARRQAQGCPPADSATPRVALTCPR